MQLLDFLAYRESDRIKHMRDAFVEFAFTKGKLLIEILMKLIKPVVTGERVRMSRNCQNNNAPYHFLPIRILIY